MAGWSATARATSTAIVEAKDASAAQREIREINTGLYAASAAFLRRALGAIGSDNAQGEYYLTDLVAIARARGLEVQAFKAAQSSEFAGINSREELAQVEAEIRMAVNRRLMASGVTLVDPATAYIGEQVEIGTDTIIGPNVQILGRSRIGAGVRIDGTAWLRDVIIGDRSHLKIGIRAEKCLIGEDCELGPFAHLREGTELEGHNRIGNFVETKKARHRPRHQGQPSELSRRRQHRPRDQRRMRRDHGQLRRLRQASHRDRRSLHGRLRHPANRTGQGRQRLLYRVGNHGAARGSRRRAGDVASSAARKARLDRQLASSAIRRRGKRATASRQLGIMKNGRGSQLNVRNRRYTRTPGGGADSDWWTEAA